MPNPMRISQKISITGKTTVYAQSQSGGRTITLEGWLTQDEFSNLEILYSAPGQDYALIFETGQQFQNVVIISIESSAVLDKNNNPNWIKVTAKLMTVAA